MAVNLPTSADVQKLREQTAEQAEVVRTPLLAVLGAGDYAYSTVTKVVTDARETATKRAEEVQTRVQELPDELKELRGKLSSDNIRKQIEEFRPRSRVSTSASPSAVRRPGAASASSRRSSRPSRRSRT